VQVGYVKGLDLSPQEIDEARRRYGELMAKHSGALPLLGLVPHPASSST
jgi:hypothetical protein